MEIGRRFDREHKRLLAEAEARGDKKLAEEEITYLSWDLDDFKLEAVKKHFGRHEGKVVWIDDDAGHRPQWCAPRKNFLFVNTNPLVGVTDEHRRMIAEWAGVPA